MNPHEELWANGGGGRGDCSDAFFDFLLERVDPQEIKTALDVGAGTGNFLRRLAQSIPGVATTAVEIYEPAAQNLTGFVDEVFVASVVSCELPKIYDLVVASVVLCCIPPSLIAGTRERLAAACGRYLAIRDFSVSQQPIAEIPYAHEVPLLAYDYEGEGAEWFPDFRLVAQRWEPGSSNTVAPLGWFLFERDA